MSEQTESLKIAGSFDSRIADIRDANLSQLHQLSVSVRWPHRAEDWHFLTSVGRGVVALDEIDRVLGSAMWFPFGDAIATIGMVITSPRLQENGTAQWLVQHILEQCGDRELRVNTPANVRRFFKSLGFLQTRSISQFQGHVNHFPLDANVSSEGELRALKRDDIEAAIALDALAFGADRSKLIERLASEGSGFGVFEGRELRSFALYRPFGRGGLIGPIVSSDVDDAIALVTKHVEGRNRQFLRVDTPFAEGRFADLLIANGLNSAGTVVTMVRPRSTEREPQTSHPLIYGLASHTLG